MLIIERTAFNNIETRRNRQYALDHELGRWRAEHIKTTQKVQRFKILKRKELRAKHAKGKIKVADFTLAAANRIKHQPLDVSRVEVSEYEISPDT